MKTYHIAGLIFIIALISFSCKGKITEQDDLKSAPEVQKVQIQYKYGFKNELNTFTQKYTKDLVLDGTITIDFRLTEEEQNRILNMADQVDFFNLPDSLVRSKTDSLGVDISPDPGIQFLKVKSESKAKTVYWLEINSFPREYERLLKLTTLINEVIVSKKEYKELPPARGGYL